MNQLFRMPVQSVFELDDEGLVMSGLVVSGRVAEGAASIGDMLVIVSEAGDKRVAELSGIEMPGKMTDTAACGDDVGLLFAGLKKGDVSKGDIIMSQE